MSRTKKNSLVSKVNVYRDFYFIDRVSCSKDIHTFEP